MGILAAGLVGLGLTGCTGQKEHFLLQDPQVCDYKKVATEIEYPDVCNPRLTEVEQTLEPRTLRNRHSDEIWDLPLEEAIQTALANSKVMRDLGGRVVNAPGTLGTVYEPVIQESDPRYGVEASLSAFDAQVQTVATFNKNDRPLNQVVDGVFPAVFQQDLFQSQTTLQKTNATGGTWNVTSTTRYDANNNPNNRFPSYWEQYYDVGFRQPLLQGSGVTFNRIAGPNASPGFYFSNGVMIARVNNDIALADFEAGVQRLVSDTENAYWDLYFAYRDLDSKVAARDAALQTWRRLYALRESGSPGGEAENEAQAREQYYFFRAQVEDALSGTPGGSTQSGSGSSAGQFRGAGGVYARENNLRYMMGLTSNDGRLIRPSDEPTLGKVDFLWNDILAEALCRRVELRRQRWTIKRREMELLASKNFLLPRLDATGNYRFRGFGDELLNYEDNGEFDDAYSNLLGGDFQEWSAGLNFTAVIGRRQALAGVRNAELRLARDRAVLQEQELQISHDLAGAIRELDRAYQLAETNFNRRLAAQNQLSAAEAAREAGRVTLDVVLDAQRRLADAESNYYRSLIEYNLAIKSVHFEKGSLLEYNGVCLAEGPWPNKAYHDAYRNARRRAAAEEIDYGFTFPDEVSLGRVRQFTGMGVPMEGEIVEGEMIYEGIPEGAVIGQPTEALPQAPTPADDAQPLPYREDENQDQVLPGPGTGLKRRATVTGPSLQAANGPTATGVAQAEPTKSSLTIKTDSAVRPAGYSAAAPTANQPTTSTAASGDSTPTDHQAARPHAGWQRVQR